MHCSAREILEKTPVEASAPCRIDMGGTWDIKAMALPFEDIGPVTVNMALNIRTKVTLSAFEDHKVKISSDGFAEEEIFATEHLPLDSTFALFFAAISHFGFEGLELRISSQSPVKSALGGSSTALVALIKALDKINVRLGKTGHSHRDILHLAYHLEDAVAGGNCGIQDQAAATYGGVNLWKWRYANRDKPFERTALLKNQDLDALSKRLIIAFSGKSHIASASNRKWLKDFLSGKTRAGWIEANEIVREFARKVQARRWSEAALVLRQEMAVRRKITPEALIPITEALVQTAERLGCGARFAGAGAGGAVWAIGEMGAIFKVREAWKDAMEPIPGAAILDCRVDQTGVI